MKTSGSKIVTDQDFQKLWNVYELALKASDYILADFIIRIAAEYCFMQGLKNDSQPSFADTQASIQSQPKTFNIDIEAQRLRDTLCMLQKQSQHDREFEFTVFRETLRRIFAWGIKKGRTNAATFFQQGFSPL